VRASRDTLHEIRISERAWAWWFVLPALTLLAVLALGPIAASLWLSLRRRLPIFGVDDFVGLQNYATLWHDGRFWHAAGITLYFTAVSVALELVLGLGLALLLAGRDTWGRPRAVPAWLRVVMLVPWAVPTVVSARMWEWLYQADYGLLSHLAQSLGLHDGPVSWLATPWTALHAAIVMDVWKATPFAALLLLGGLQTIPSDLYLAARVDGAGRWAVFRRITWPLLAPAVLIAVTFRTMDALRVFDAVYVLTGGGPGNGTETLSIYAYKTLFQSLQFGYGTTQAAAMFLLAAALAAVYLWGLRTRTRAAWG
jgi:multiple sugar transport system permease protein